MNWGFYFGPAVLINFTNVETKDLAGIAWHNTGAYMGREDPNS